MEFEWWGNTIPYTGCEGRPCTLQTLDKDQYFGPRIGQFK